MGLAQSVLSALAALLAHREATVRTELVSLALLGLAGLLDLRGLTPRCPVLRGQQVHQEAQWSVLRDRLAHRALTHKSPVLSGLLDLLGLSALLGLPALTAKFLDRLGLLDRLAQPVVPRARLGTASNPSPLNSPGGQINMFVCVG